MTKESLTKAAGAWKALADAAKEAADGVQAERDEALAKRIPEPFAGQPTTTTTEDTE